MPDEAPTLHDETAPGTDEPAAVEQTLPSGEAIEAETDAAPPAASVNVEPAEAVAPPPPIEPPVNNKHWYVVKVQSGREETIKESIERRVKIEGLEEYYGQIYIPSEKVIEMRKGKRYTREKKTLPGYIMAEVEYNDRVLYLFRETPGVGDFVGATVNKPPPPMTPTEVARWMHKKEQGQQPTPVLTRPDMEKGDRVKVKDGIWKEMEGEVKDVLEAKGMVRVQLTIFGRPVDVELEYWHVERV